MHQRAISHIPGSNIFNYIKQNEEIFGLQAHEIREYQTKCF
jgi:hypothetical protein